MTKDVPIGHIVRTMQTILAKTLDRLALTDVEFGRRVGCKSQHINKIKHGRSRPSPEMAKAIEAALDGAVRRGDLRPDLWPEDRAA